jgi:hypothetical protein
VEKDTRASLVTRPDGTIGFRMGQAQFNDYNAGVSAAAPDYTRTRAPALAIYAGGQSAFRLSSASPERRAGLQAFLTTIVEPWRSASIDQFRRGARVGEVLIMDAVHHLFLHKPEETAALVTRFIGRHPAR